MTAHFSLVNYAITLSFLIFLKSTNLYIYVTALLDAEPSWQKSAHIFVDLSHICTWDKKTFHVSNKIELFPQWISPYSEQSPWILFTIHSGLTDVLWETRWPGLLFNPICPNPIFKLCIWLLLKDQMQKSWKICKKKKNSIGSSQRSGYLCFWKELGQHFTF